MSKKANSTALGTRIAFQRPEIPALGFSVEEASSSFLEEKKIPFFFSRFTVDPDCHSVPEQHAEAEVWLIAGGSGVLRIEDEETVAEPGMAFYLPPGVQHELVNTGKTAIHVFSTWWLPSG